MKTLFFNIFFFTILCVSAQQVRISGKVTDLEGKPVAVASIILHYPDDSTKTVSTTTSSSGEFFLSTTLQTEVILNVKHIVFEEDTFHLRLTKDTVINIRLNPRSYLLNEVAITASKPRYVIRDDGNMIVNVEKIPGSENDNAFDLLKKLPGVIASDNQGISLNGQNIELQVDGRDMSYVDVMALLKALPAFSLSQIELISIKGAEHDGESQAIINLKTKRQSIDGYFGMIGAGGRYYLADSQVGMGQAFIMFKSKNITFNTSFSADYFNVKASGIDATLYGNQQQTIINRGYQRDKELHLSNNSGLEWDIASGQKLFANLSLFDSQLDRNTLSDYQNEVNNSGVNSIAIRNAPRYMFSGNMEYQVGQLLKIYYGYVRGNSSYCEDFTNDYSSEQIVQFTHNESNIEGQHIGKLDFNRKYLSEKLNVKAGAKITSTSQNNGSHYIPDTLATYPDRLFEANENIVAAYASLSYKISKKISATIGFRSEYTYYHIKDLLASENAHPSYWNYLPNAQINIRLTAWYSFIPYFTSNISRPQYQTLLPGKRYTDDYNYSEGNPYLKPVKNYLTAISNSFLNKINLTFGYAIHIDNMSNIKIDKGAGITENTYMDVADGKNFYLSSSVPFDLRGKGKLSGNINYNWQKGKYYNLRNGFVIPVGKNEFNTMKLNGYCNYRIAQNIGINAQLFYFIKNKQIQIESDSYASLDLGLNMTLLKSKRLSLTLSACDIFNSVKNSYHLYYDNNVLFSDRKIPSQYIGLIISYRFFGGKSFDKNDSETNDINRFTK